MPTWAPRASASASFIGALSPVEINSPIVAARVSVIHSFIRLMFGRRTNANPLMARLAQHFNCPIHGARIIRLPDNRFRAELTEEIQPARDAKGDVDIAGTMQVIMNVIEGWVREHPEQWLWLHRRWR